VDSFEPVEEILVHLNNYTFDGLKKSILKRNAKKRKTKLFEKDTQEQMMVWDKTHLNDEEFVEETTNVLGAFVDAKK
jgi:hypothetical protein